MGPRDTGRDFIILLIKEEDITFFTKVGFESRKKKGRLWVDEVAVKNYLMGK